MEHEKCVLALYVDCVNYNVYRLDAPYADDAEVKRECDLAQEEKSSGEWLLDDEGTGNEQADIVDSFVSDFTAKFPSFCCPQKSPYINGQWASTNAMRVILENESIYIAVDENSERHLDNDMEQMTFAVFRKGDSPVPLKYQSGAVDILLMRVPSITVKRKN